MLNQKPIAEKSTLSTTSNGLDTDVLLVAREKILTPANLNESALESLLGGMLNKRLIDCADIYFQHSHSESWGLEDGIVKSGSYNINRGVGVQAMAGEKTGFAYTDNIDLPALEQATGAAKKIAVSGSSGKLKTLGSVVPQPRYPAIDPVAGMDSKAKVNMLLQLDTQIRALDTRIKKVNINLSAGCKTILVMCTDGVMAADVRPLIRFDVSVIVEDQNGRRESGHSGGGGRGSYSDCISFAKTLEFGNEAVRQALVNLSAISAPAGNMPVVLGSGWPAVLLHEAVGHGLEGDFNRKGISTYSGRIGEQVASKLCTIVDDGTLQGRRGSLTVDDEGMPSACTVLIENGILRGYMQDKLNARLMGQQTTSNGRRQSYAHTTLPRMTNTYMMPGKHELEEILQTVNNGLYAVNFGGGSVDITSGRFVFSATEAYLIENGKVTAPVKGATLIGNGPEVMNKVSMVGNDLQFDTGVGICGKDGQTIPVGVGQPVLKIDNMTVGGTEI